MPEPRIEILIDHEEFVIGIRRTDLESGVTVSSVSTSVDPATGLTLVGSPSADVDTSKQTINGATAGEYKVYFDQTLSDGQKFRDEYSVIVK